MDIRSRRRWQLTQISWLWGSSRRCFPAFHSRRFKCSISWVRSPAEQLIVYDSVFRRTLSITCWLAAAERERFPWRWLSSSLPSSPLSGACMLGDQGSDCHHLVTLISSKPVVVVSICGTIAGQGLTPKTIWTWRQPTPWLSLLSERFGYKAQEKPALLPLQHSTVVAMNWWCGARFGSLVTQPQGKIVHLNMCKVLSFNRCADHIVRIIAWLHRNPLTYLFTAV